MTTTNDNDDRYNVLLRRIRALSLEHRSDALVYLSGYRPDETERALDQIDAWNAATAPCPEPHEAWSPTTGQHLPFATPCPVCSDTFRIAVSPPDRYGNVETEECCCRPLDELDPEERWYALHDGWVS